MGTRVIAVVGATATGKSGLATELALALGGEVVNADSMQLYQGMDIGTAKEPEAARRGVPHHLLDIWPVTQTANVADYAKLARTAIDEIIARGRVPVLAGGSGLYVRAALDDLDFPGTDEAIRASLEEELARVGAAALHARLARLDPAAAAAILPGNGRRIVRALEVIEISGRPFAATMPAFTENRPAVQVGLTLPRPELDQRIAARVDRMWEAGLEAEVRGQAGDDEGHQAVRPPPGILVPPRPPGPLARRQPARGRRSDRGARAYPDGLGGPAAGQVLQLLGQGFGHEQPGQQVRLRGQCPERHRDADVVIGPVHDLDRVAGLDFARLDYPEVGPGHGGQREPPDPAGLRQPALEGAARDPRRGRLQDQVRPDPPPLADQRAVGVGTLGRQVLAEHPVRQRPAELSRPEVEVLPRVGVHGLVRPAVVPHVVDPVPASPTMPMPLA